MPNDVCDIEVAEVMALREQLLEKILTRDRMLFVESWLLKYKYMRLFSAKECAIYDMNSRVLCCKLQQKLTKEGFKPEEIGSRLAEFKAMRHEVWLAHMQYRNRALQNTHSFKLNRHWFDRLDCNYALCVRLIHPDLYPDATDWHRRQMKAITAAYGEHNLPYLALKPEMLQMDRLPSYAPEKFSLEELAAERERLLCAIADCDSMMKLCESERPLNLRQLLSDDAACQDYAKLLDDVLLMLRDKLKSEDISEK